MKAMTLRRFASLHVAALFLALPALAHAQGAAAPAAATKVQSMGQAAIFGGDTAAARDKAIDDALRKAVEQAVGTMVSSETVTQNFQLLSDKIFSKSRGYVRNYKIVSEGQDSGAYVVKVEAEVSSGNLQNDVQGILQVLKAKNMPRVLVMIAEQQVGASGTSAWWQDKGFSTSLDAVENSFMNAWLPKGVKFVDRQALQGKIKVGPAITSTADPSADAIKEFGTASGADVVIVGKAVASVAGSIMGSQLQSVRAEISLRVISVDNGNIIATATRSEAVSHVNPPTGGTLALKKAGEAAAGELLEKILATWEAEVAGPSTIQLVIHNVKAAKDLRVLAQTLREQVRGVQEVRQRSYKKKVAELEVELKGSAQDLAEELQDKKFPGFQIEIDEITQNTVTASLK